MADEAVIDYARQRGFHQQTLGRWLGLAESDRDALLSLARELKVGENHFRDLLDWLEEIRLRDGTSAAEILRSPEIARILSHPRLGRNDKLKRLKEELRRLRFPRLAQLESEIEKRLRGLKLPPQIGISFPPGLEGGCLVFQVRAASREDLQESVAELERLLNREELQEVFALIGGRAGLGEERD